MVKKVQIRNLALPERPRVFDVTVDERGRILRYDLQHIRGRIFVEAEDVLQQIREALGLMKGKEICSG